MDIEPSKLSIVQLLRLGQEDLQQEHDAMEADKLGTLRAGNTGSLTERGFVGKCPRVAFLRSRGIQEPPSRDRYLMFAAGVANEAVWQERLQRAWTGKVLCEEDIPTTWTTSNGKEVTGRPDMVLIDNNDKPVLGIELKLVSSYWTARNVHALLQPSREHLAQACHYMWQLECPFKLVYTSRVDWSIPWKFMGEWDGKPDVEYRSDKPWKVLPFVREYSLSLRDGVLWYHTEGLEGWVKTLITVESIQKYYEAVASIETTQTLPPRPTDLNAVGESTYKPCKYCSFRSVCDSYENDFTSWVDAATLKVKGIDV